MTFNACRDWQAYRVFGLLSEYMSCLTMTFPFGGQSKSQCKVMSMLDGSPGIGHRGLRGLLTTRSVGESKQSVEQSVLQVVALLNI
jgi:hypothetical protein